MTSPTRDRPRGEEGGDASPKRIRLDVWLDVACLFKTRSEAQRACRGGKVDVNDQRAKPHRTVQAGDRLAITRTQGRKQLVVVRSAAEHHLPKAEARTLYEDVTPPLTEAEREMRRLVATTPVPGPPAGREGPRRARSPRPAASEARLTVLYFHVSGIVAERKGMRTTWPTTSTR